jgi:flagellar biosynthetic protein FliR
MLSTSFSIYHLEYYLLIFVRIAGVISIAPIYGTKGVPRRVRVGLALCVALLVASVTEYEPLNYTSLIGFTVLIVKEAVMGLSIGLASNLCMTIINLAGMFIDREIGFTMVTEFDQTANANVTISAEFYNYAVLLVMLCSNMHYFIISAICDSFQVVPVGGALFDGESLYALAITFMQQYFIIGFRIALPIFISITLCNVVLGVLAKTAPQMNMFSIGIELKLMLGLMVMIITVYFLPNITEYIYDLTEDMVLNMIKTMY